MTKKTTNNNQLINLTIMKYYYMDNWSGDVRQFNSLREAKKSARKEDGRSIAICNANGVVCTVKASGIVYA